MPKMAPSKLKTKTIGMFNTNKRAMDTMTNFCSWRFFILWGCNNKYMKKAVLQNEVPLFIIIN